jgi:hypothetical protein
MDLREKVRRLCERSAAQKSGKAKAAAEAGRGGAGMKRKESWVLASPAQKKRWFLGSLAQS